MNMNGQKFLSTSKTRIEKKAFPQKRKVESTTVFINETVTRLNYNLGTTGFRYNKYQAKKSLKIVKSEKPVSEKNLKVLKSFSKIPVSERFRKFFHGGKLAAKKEVNDKESSPIASPASLILPPTNDNASRENPSCASFCEIFNAKTQIDEVKSTSATGAVHKAIFNSSMNLKFSERIKNQNPSKLPIPINCHYKKGFVPYYHGDLQKMPKENCLEAEWSIGLSLEGGHEKTTDMYTAIWLEKISRKN